MRNRKDISEKAEEIFSCVDAGENLTRKDAAALLQIGRNSALCSGNWYPQVVEKVEG